MYSFGKCTFISISMGDCAYLVIIISKPTRFVLCIKRPGSPITAGQCLKLTEFSFINFPVVSSVIGPTADPVGIEVKGPLILHAQRPFREVTTVRFT